MAAVIGLGAWVAAYQPPADDVTPLQPSNISTSDLPGSELLMASGNDAVDDLMRDAWRDIGNARFVGPGDDNALSRLRRVRDIDPDNVQAKSALMTLYAYFMRKAQRVAERGDLQSAIAHGRQAAAAASVSDEDRSAARHFILELGEVEASRQTFRRAR